MFLSHLILINGQSMAIDYFQLRSSTTEREHNKGTLGMQTDYYQKSN